LVLGPLRHQQTLLVQVCQGPLRPPHPLMVPVVPEDQLDLVLLLVPHCLLVPDCLRVQGGQQVLVPQLVLLVLSHH